jgi:hypothetical protein
LQVISRGSPVPGEEFVEAGVWPEIDETGEDVSEVPLSLLVLISEAAMARFSAPSFEPGP